MAFYLPFLLCILLNNGKPNFNYKKSDQNDWLYELLITRKKVMKMIKKIESFVPNLKSLSDLPLETLFGDILMMLRAGGLLSLANKF